MSTPNPYAAPRAQVADAADAPRNFLPAGRAVPAARGWNWIAEGWELFRRQPGAWIALVIVALLLPLFMALWSAPALAMFHQQGPAEAMKASFVACLKTILPFLVYSVIALLLALIASIPLGLGWLVLGPVMAASLYTSY